MTNEEAIFDLEQFALAPIGDGDLHRESVELALSALREQAERDKGCMRCKRGKGFYTGAAWIYIGNDGSLSITTSKDGIVDFPANTITHCPWCGKRLEVQHE